MKATSTRDPAAKALATCVVWKAIGREFTIATNQVDFAVPRKFGLVYRDRDNAEKAPLCIHRAPLGTHERFIGFLIEHYAGNFPLWLAPDQVRVITIGDGLVSVRNPKGMWSVIADGARVYAWKEGERAGIVAAQNSEDLINYLLGVLSPAQIMIGGYLTYREHPDQFRIVEKNGTIEYSLKKKDDAFSAAFTFLLRKSPPWLLGFRFTNPEVKQTAEVLFSPPEQVPEIPKSLLVPPPEVEFREGIIPWQGELIPYI